MFRIRLPYYYPNAIAKARASSVEPGAAPLISSVPLMFVFEVIKRVPPAIFVFALFNAAAPDEPFIVRLPAVANPVDVTVPPVTVFDALIVFGFGLTSKSFVNPILTEWF